MPNYITLANHEARRLAEEGTLLVVRPVVPQPTHGEPEPTYLSWWSWNDTCAGTTKAALHNTLQAWSPLGAPGDVLVCKEAWCGSEKTMRGYFRADLAYWDFAKNEPRPDMGEPEKCHWRPASTMPAWAVRFRPVVREAGVMRVGDIPGVDAEAMGLDVAAKLPAFPPMGVDIDALVDMVGKQVLAAYWTRRFRKYPWESNPWCWTAWVETPEAAARDEWAQREANKRRAMLEDMWWEEQNA